MHLSGLPSFYRALARAISSNPLAYIVDVITEMIALIFVTGAAPIMALPYFRKFKITSVNASPFHTSFIYTMIGVVGGTGIVLTFASLVLKVITGPEATFYEDFIFPVLFGLSLHYTIGAFLGRDKAENIVKEQIESGSGKRVAKGIISIQGPDK